MTLMQWLGVACVVSIVGFVFFAFRQGIQVKPDKDRKIEDWPKITQGGSGG
jgi:hypothetical protein